MHSLILFMCACVCLFVCLSVCISVCLFFGLFICLFVRLFVRLRSSLSLSSVIPLFLNHSSRRKNHECDLKIAVPCDWQVDSSIWKYPSVLFIFFPAIYAIPNSPSANNNQQQFFPYIESLISFYIYFITWLACLK